MKHDFPFSGLIACGHCGCALVGETKKQRYTYYHCTSYRGKCGEPYVREEVLAEAFSELLEKLEFSEQMFHWVCRALRESHGDKKKDQAASVIRLQAEHAKLQARLDAMYLDKLDGKIGQEFFERMSSEWRIRQSRCLHDIERHQQADQSYTAEGIRILELARDSRKLFEEQETRQKRRLLNLVLSNCTWKDGELAAEFRQPFDQIAKATCATALAVANGNTKNIEIEIWRPREDSNLRPPV